MTAASISTRSHRHGSRSGDASASSEPGSPIPVFDLAHIPMDDAKVYEMLQKAETIGVFQV